MHPLKELQKILVGTAPRRTVGKVVRVTGAQVDIVVSGRLRQFARRNDATSYRVGDSVATQGEVMLGRVTRQGKVKTYSI